MLLSFFIIFQQAKLLTTPISAHQILTDIILTESQTFFCKENKTNHILTVYLKRLAKIQADLQITQIYHNGRYC